MTQSPTDTHNTSPGFSSSTRYPSAQQDSLFHQLVTAHSSVLSPFLYSSAETSAWPAVILDGGGGSYLAPHIPQSPPSPLWSAHCLLSDTGRTAIRSLHRTYLDAGADIITAVSYQAWQAGFQRVAGCSEVEAEALMRASVELAVGVRDEWWDEAGSTHHAGRQRPLVAASIGCYGALMNGGQEYTGDYGGVTTAEVERVQRRRIEAVCAVEGVDVLLLETMANMDEVRALLASTLPDVCPHLPVIVSLSATDASRMRDGTPLREAFDFILQHTRTTGTQVDSESTDGATDGQCSIVAFGVNCCAAQYGRDIMQLAKSAVLEHYQSLHTQSPTTTSALSDPSLPLPTFYPNSGEQYDAESGTFYGERQLQCEGGGVELTALVVGWYEAGARVLGGCCRTDERYIRHVRDVIINRQQQDAADGTGTHTHSALGRHSAESAQRLQQSSVFSVGHTDCIR